MKPLVCDPHVLGDLLDIARTDSRQAARIVQAIIAFERAGTGDVKALKGRSNETRLRVGDWRVIIAVEADRAVVTRIVNRRDAYD